MTAHLEIVQTDDPVQPWHVRIVGGNHEVILAGETLHNESDAKAAVLAVAEMFVDYPSIVGTGYPIDWKIEGKARPGGTPVVYVDQRAGSEPPC